jgi:hypothetical protein
MVVEKLLRGKEGRKMGNCSRREKMATDRKKRTPQFLTFWPDLSPLVGASTLLVQPFEFNIFSARDAISKLI